MSGIKISSSGSGDAATACATTPATIVYYDGTSISNGTVIYTDLHLQVHQQAAINLMVVVIGINLKIIIERK